MKAKGVIGSWKDWQVCAIFQDSQQDLAEKKRREARCFVLRLDGMRVVAPQVEAKNAVMAWFEKKGP